MMTSSSSSTSAARFISDASPLLALPAELRSRIYDFAFCVDSINAIQHNTSSSNKGNNKYYALNDTYSMTFEFRDRNTWQNGSQSLATFLALTTVCRQIRAEIAPLAPFSQNIFNVGFHAIQHFLDMVPSTIRDDIKVISLWKWPGKMMSCVGDMQFAGNHDENDRRVWTTLIDLLRDLPALERVILHVRGSMSSLGFGANWQPALQNVMEKRLEAHLGRKVTVEWV